MRQIGTKIKIFILLLLISTPLQYEHKKAMLINVGHGWARILSRKYPNMHVCSRPIGNRYEYLKGKYSIFIAVNLHNNQDILPPLMFNLMKLMDEYFMDKIYLRIFESGSNDKTKEILESFDSLLQNYDFNYEIETSDIIKNDFTTNRIDYLAYMRNYAIKPISKNRLTADYVLFLNDVYFCFDDVLELLHQQTINKADMVGGMDYWWDGKSMIFYDSWVAQDINGNHPGANELGQSKVYIDPHNSINPSLPVQMMCLWNGMVSIKASVFKNIEFRRGLNGVKGQTQPGECSASEITSLCMDMIKYGFKKILMVPQVKVAYHINSYNKLKYENNTFSFRYPSNKEHGAEEDVPIQWKSLSDNHHCWPYYNKFRNREQNKTDYYMEDLPGRLHHNLTGKRLIS
eukprot:NODE_279_length_11907_cov_0.265244.p3 type:complete len:402 gc:universal NODE_279_length_11907_cov_0.265244:6957-8162(+)